MILSPADIIVSEIGGPESTVMASNMHAPVLEDESLVELEQNWVDALNARNGQGSASASSGSSSSKRKHKDTQESTFGNSNLRNPENLLFLQSGASTEGVLTDRNQGSDDPDAIENTWIDDKTNRVICKFKSGKEVALGILSNAY